MPGAKNLTERRIREQLRSNPKWTVTDLCIRTGWPKDRMVRFLQSHHIPIPGGQDQATGPKVVSAQVERLLPSPRIINEACAERWKIPLPEPPGIPASLWEEAVELYRQLGDSLPDEYARYGPWGALMYKLNVLEADRERLARAVHSLNATELNKRVLEQERTIREKDAMVAGLQDAVRRLNSSVEELKPEPDRLRKVADYQYSLYREESNRRREAEAKLSAVQASTAADLGARDKEIAQLKAEVEETSGSLREARLLAAYSEGRLRDFIADKDGSRARAVQRAREDAVNRFIAENNIEVGYPIDRLPALHVAPLRAYAPVGKNMIIVVPLVGRGGLCMPTHTSV